MGTKKKAVALTLATSLLSSVIIAVFGLIYNQKVMELYGSPINGLISTLAQFVSLFSILEGGYTTAAIMATYKPIVNKDYRKLNNILYTAKITYCKVGGILSALALGGGAVYIHFINSPISAGQTFALLFVTITVTSLSFFLQLKYGVLFNGLNYQHIQVIIAFITRTVTWIISILLIFQSSGIVLVYSINVLNVLLNVLLCKLYVKKCCGYVTFKGTYNPKVIKGTGDVLFQKITNTAFTSTDLILISAGIGLASASVYIIYSQIFIMVVNLLNSAVQAPFNSFGHLVNENDKDSFKKYFSAYRNLVLLATAVVLTSVGAVIINFIGIYTARISDINYIMPSVVILFYSQFFVTIMNKPYSMVLNINKNFKEQNIQCALAVVLNLSISLIGMHRFGISGIIFGSVIGTAVILVMNMIQCYRKSYITKWKYDAFLMIVNYAAGLSLIVLSIYALPFSAVNYIQWFGVSALKFVLCAVVLIAFNFLVNRVKMTELCLFAKDAMMKKHVKIF